MDLSPATTLVKAYQSGSGPLTAMVLRDKAIYYANAGMEEDGLLVDSTIVLVKLVFQMQLDLAQRIAPGTALSRKFGNGWLPTAEQATEAPPGMVTVWPLRRDGSLGVWQATPETLLALTGEGFTKAVQRPEGWALSYVPTGVRGDGR